MLAMMHLLVLPILIPLVTAIAVLLSTRVPRLQRTWSLLGSVGLLAATIALLHGVWGHGIQHVQMGTWTAPFGITLVADLLSAVLLVVTGLMGVAVLLYAMGTIDAGRERSGFHALYHLLLMGVAGAFLAGDLFNLYVWFEVLLITSFVLLVLGTDRAQVRGSVTYVLVNLVASLCFLLAVGLLYGMAGTLNLADLAVRLPEVGAPGLVTAIAMLFLVAFGIKAAVFPLFFWLPAAYHTPPIAISALFAGLLTKVGVYALIRVFTLLFTQDVGYTHTILLVVASLTMVTGVLGAVAQADVRKILSFHIVSQIGYMVMGLALFTPLALLGAIFYIVHHIVVKTNLFLVGGVAERIVGHFDLGQMGGLYRSRPLLAVLFLVPALSLAGLPPLSGFWAKLIILQAGLEAEAYFAVGAALIAGILTLVSMTKIWSEAFWKPLPVEATGAPVSVRGLLVPVVLLAAVTIAIGLYAEPLAVLAERSAAELLDPSAYITAVLGADAPVAATQP
ncbi:Na+/H+ antiporter subunit D [Salinibacter sp. 10B]|nr:Na+/H+ antiporter subunit D [Salinibacter sp. 10B]